MRAGDWAAYLEALAIFGVRPGLERVGLLLDWLDRPQDRYRIVHVVEDLPLGASSPSTRAIELIVM